MKTEKKLIPLNFSSLIRKKIFRNSPVLWANFGRISQFLAGAILPISPAVLILSLPRSGSSWVGDVLGLSSGSLYLREPIHQTYASFLGGIGPSFFEINLGKLPPAYSSSAEAAFMGLPIFNIPSVVPYPAQWSLIVRKNKAIVIKEINPLALHWITNIYKPRVIYLIRHPAAVSNSFYRLNWTGPQFDGRFSEETLAKMDIDFDWIKSSFWLEHGSVQAVILKQTLDLLEMYHDCLIIRYEDICLDPQRAFKCLYEFADLPWDRYVEDEIRIRSSSSEKIDTGVTGVHRNSSAMNYKWKQEMTETAIMQVKESFSSFELPYYQSDDW